MKINSNTSLWIFSIIIMIAGIALAIHAFVNLNVAEIVIEWTTASELETVGFNLLRGESDKGPYNQVNPDLLPASSDSLTGSNYQYLDNSVIPGNTYYYLLEEIEMTGEINQHGPIIVQANNASKTELSVAFLLIGGSVINTLILVKDQKKIRGNNLTT